MAPRNDRQPKALVCLLPGLGDALTASTVLRRLNKDGYCIDVLTMLRPVADYARQLSEVDKVIDAPLLNGLTRSAKPLLELRRARYDVCIVPFPATRWQYAAVARAVNARKIVTHNYGGLFSALLIGSNSVAVPLEGGHRLWENDRLADALNLRRVSEYTYLVPASWRAQQMPGVLGVHPGTMIYKGNEARRWRFDRFVAVIEAQLSLRRKVRVFFGPNETEDEMRFLHLCESERVEVVRAPLDEAARKLAECEVFVGNDAGFSHLAAALNVKTLTLFGMTNPTRAIPIGPAVALRPSSCPACHDEGLRGFECVRRLDYRCLNDDLSVDSVNHEIDRLFTAKEVPQQIEKRGPFSLYGRVRTSQTFESAATTLRKDEPNT